MITVQKKTTIAAISELRNKSEQILKNVKDHNVILERHNKPVAVMVDYSKYAFWEQMLDFAEDYILGSMALKRDKKSKLSDFVPIENW